MVEEDSDTTEKARKYYEERKSRKDEQKTKKKIFSRLIEEEMKKSYLDYAMSVIVGRALPDVKDGLKPVHRRILYAMWQMSMLHNKPYKKCARIVGEVLGKYHPHGDTAVYDALVRMAQDFSLRYPLIQGQGNFGSVDGDSPAAMRYCITGNSLILTDRGILPIRNISNKQEAKINMNILSYNGKNNPASKFFNSGKHNILELKTKLGYNIKGSYNHPLMCWTYKNNFPQIEWKLLENIKKNDIILLNRNYSLFSKKSLNLKQYYSKKGFKNDVKLPKKVNNDLAFLLGALVSEGSFHNNQILFNNKDKEFYNKVKSIILSQFKGIQLYERKIKGKCTELSIYEQKVVIFLKNIGLNQERSDKKELPFSILRSTKENIKHFLIALFEGDGSVIYRTDKRHSGKSIQLSYDSKSTNLIEQLKILLLNFGIVTTNAYKDKRNECYKLIISGYDSIKKFKDKINFFSERKTSILANINSMNSYRMGKTDYIPYTNEYLRKKYKKEFIIKNNLDRYNNLEKNYNKLIKIIDSKDKQLINFILKNKYLFNEVLEIKKITKKEEVYSIKVDSKCHSFIANGFINHNTEARLSRIAEEMLFDIDKETVNFVPNFDDSLKEPSILPSKIPNLLINGSSGIAVGMATNVPPHNIIEVCDGIITTINKPDIAIKELIQIIKGPDFPTGAIITGSSGILQSYSNGRGKITVKSKADIEKGKIIVTEIPYMVNKSQLIEEIANLVKNKTVTGISDIRDESDRSGMRIVIELKKDANPEIALNQLFKHSRLQVTFGINTVALVNNEPKTLNLKELIKYFIEHRKEIVTKRTSFDLNRAEKKKHILEGIIVALDNIDSVIKLIKKSKSAEIAKNNLIEEYRLSIDQAQAILDMRLQRLTSLEQEKIKEEHKHLLKLIEELKLILASEQRILDIIKNELEEIKNKYGDKRKTQIIETEEVIEIEDLIKEEDVVVTITHSGYVKRTSLNEYKQQKRGGKGVIAALTKDEDFIENIFVANTHSYILCFTETGDVHWLKVYQIPESSRHSKGKAIINLLNTKENITAFIPIMTFREGYLFMATKKGIVKKTSALLFSKPRKGGIKAITLDNDRLINVKFTNGSREIILATKKGRAVRFHEKNIRSIGRTGQGVRGIRLKKDDEVIGMVIAKEDRTLLTITENGYGKRTKITSYRLISRGGSGVRNIIYNERNGNVVAIKSVKEDDEIMLISKNGITIRMPVSNINIIGRNTQGVRLMKLENDKVVAAAKIIGERLNDNERNNHNP